MLGITKLCDNNLIKLKLCTPYDSTSLLLAIYQSSNLCKYSATDMYNNIYSNFIHVIPDWKQFHSLTKSRVKYILGMFIEWDST